MFREMRRINQQTSIDEAKEVVKNSRIGVLSLMGDDGYPYGVYLDYFYDIENNKLYFHGATEGHKIDSIRRLDKCSFTILSEPYKMENEWFNRYTSVVIFGRIKEVLDYNIKISILKNLGNKYYPSKDEVLKMVERPLDNVFLLELKVEHITGKKIKEK